MGCCSSKQEDPTVETYTLSKTNSCAHLPTPRDTASAHSFDPASDAADGGASGSAVTAPHTLAPAAVPTPTQSKYVVVTDRSHSTASIATTEASPYPNPRLGVAAGVESTASLASTSERAVTPSVVNPRLGEDDMMLSPARPPSKGPKILRTAELTRLCGLGQRDANYELLSLLGEGGYSKVRLGREEATGEEFAIKIINKKRLSNQQRRDQLTREVEIMLKLTHPNVVRLHDAFESKDKMYIVTEVMRGGELLDRVIDDGNLSEKECCGIIKQLVDALQYLHNHGVVHRDIKPQNILLSTEAKDSPVKITDFGLSALVTPDAADLMKTAVGSPHFMAPEIMTSDHYGGGVDVWALGVMMYFLLSGLLPFDGENPTDVFNAIRRGEYHFPDEFWAPISAEAKALIDAILVTDPAERISLPDILQTDWILNADSLSDTPIPDVGVRLGANKHKTKGQFRANVTAVMAAVKFGRLSKQYQDRKELRRRSMEVEHLERRPRDLSSAASETSELTVNVPDLSVTTHDDDTRS